MRKLITIALLVLMTVFSLSAKTNVTLAGNKACLYELSELFGEEYKTIDDMIKESALESLTNKDVLYSNTSIRSTSKEHYNAQVELVTDNPDKVLVTAYKDYIDFLIYHNGRYHFIRCYEQEE
jgi:hypothetical protein